MECCEICLRHDELFEQTSTSNPCFPLSSSLEGRKKRSQFDISYLYVQHICWIIAFSCPHVPSFHNESRDRKYWASIWCCFVISILPSFFQTFPNCLSLSIPFIFIQIFFADSSSIWSFTKNKIINNPLVYDLRTVLMNILILSDERLPQLWRKHEEVCKRVMNIIWGNRLSRNFHPSLSAINIQLWRSEHIKNLILQEQKKIDAQLKMI